ncbi:DUF721 domain-containing protein [Dendrosporobacter sp. 1207_IL3150]|uniref:DUF721 domain-containing protein n=1 Tax=Dendrosporobacter sp. 1207_IL3150 TaxID=3084054 RepID=UPI002FD9CFE1
MKQLREIIPNTIKNLGIAKKYNTEWAVLNWPKIVGDDIAAHASPTSVQRGVMIIAVNNSVWCHHLSMMKDEIINKVNDFIGEKLVNDIRFQAGYFKKYQNYDEDQENYETINQKLKMIKLDDTELSQANNLANVVSDDNLQRKILRIAKKHLAFKKLKKINNWHKCANCDSLCPSDVLYCTVCSIDNREKKICDIRKMLSEAPWLTYAELNKYIDCLPHEFINAKTSLMMLVAAEINNGKNDNLNLLTLVMLSTGAKPEEVNEKLIKRTLDKFGRKNYVSTPRL